MHMLRAYGAIELRVEPLKAENGDSKDPVRIVLSPEGTP